MVRYRYSKPHYPAEFERQPDEWEEILKDVTVEPSNLEVSVDPTTLSNFQTRVTFQDLQDNPNQQRADADRLIHTEISRCIAERKLHGKTKKCFDVLLETNASPAKIAKRLDYSEETVRRHLHKAVGIIKECLAAEGKFGSFPLLPGTRPSTRACLMSLDTLEERARFQAFLNQNTVTHIAYRGEGLFREVLIVFVRGKAARRINSKSGDNSARP